VAALASGSASRTISCKSYIPRCRASALYIRTFASGASTQGSLLEPHLVPPVWNHEENQYKAEYNCKGIPTVTPAKPNNVVVVRIVTGDGSLWGLKLQQGETAVIVSRNATCRRDISRLLLQSMVYGDCRSPADPASVNAIALDAVRAATKVHQTLGPGLLENSYKLCLAQELSLRGHSVRIEVPVPIIYEGMKLDGGFRIDLLVDETLIIEAKSIEALAPIHTAQVLTYLRMADKRLGLLMNFNVLRMKDGIRRIVL
jgi:GxxExxY protein